MKELLSRSIFLRLVKICLFTFSGIICTGQKTLTTTDENSRPLIGVECYNKNFSFTSISDANGRILIPPLYENDSISLKYLGYEEQSIDLSTIDLKNIEIQLIPSFEILEEVVLVGRSDIRSRDFLQRVDAIQGKDIAATNPQTSVDALSRNADVYVQKSQMGGGSPVIRGFEANKVLLVVDGVRMNNAIYRNGHLQNAITVDNSMLDQMEVIYGPSSLMYGSDALGGVIHFRTRDPILNLSDDKSSKVFGNYFARYASANQEKSIHADVNIGYRKWASLTSVTFSDFNDLRMGSRRTSKYPEYGKRFFYQAISSESSFEDETMANDNPNIQIGTGYSQFDLLQKFRFQINSKMNLTANFQYSTSSDIPRYDQLVLKEKEVFQFAEWNYGPQTRGLASLKYKWTDRKPWMDEIVMIASAQSIEESRISREFNDPNRQTGVESVGVGGLTLDVKKNINKRRKHTIYYGGDINYNTVNSEAWKEDITSGISSQDVFTRYPSGGSTMNIMGAYAQYINESPDSTLVLHGGIRFSSYSTTVKYLESDPIRWPDFFYEGIDARNNAFSWSAGVNWQPTEDWTFRLLTATAYRAPNVDDIGKLRIKNDNVVVPNTSLEAERSTNGEVNVSRRIGRRGLLSGSAFYTRLRDAIVRQNFSLPDGRTTFQDGNRTYNVEANVNAEEAEIYGVSANLKLNISRSIEFSTALSYIKGQILGEVNAPLAHIPPLYGRTQLSYLFQSWNFTLLSLYNGIKPIDQYGGSTDNPEYATPEGALAWTVYNLYADYNFKNYTFQLGLENILDKHYTPFASGLSAPGFNIVIAIRGRF